LNPRTVRGARSRNFLSTRSAHILGGSTKCESADMTLGGWDFPIIFFLLKQIAAC
jgi:hypothetical protein